MVTFRWIKMFLFFVLMLQFGGALSGDLSLSFTVRDGDKVTLPCQNLINNHHNCDTTTWIFTDSRGTPAVELVNLGQIKESDRLSVTAECSLAIKKVTAEDVGRYTCRQFQSKSGTQQGLDAVVYLSVVHMTEQKTADEVTLNCSVWTYERCKHKVKWIHNSEALDIDYSNLKTLESPCSATVTFLNDAYTHISTYDFNCSVTTEFNKEQLFTFSTQSSGALSGDLSLSFTVRDGDKVTLPCENVVKNHHNCNATNWLFFDSRSTPALSSPVTEQKNTDQVTLNCSVWTYERCEHKLKWIHDSGGLNRDYSNIKTLQSSCSAAVTFIKSSYSHISNSDFKCSVNKEQLFTFRPQSS
ncbi:uncharacterized protein LOC118453495, partial [Neolamprologus brichardi]|uniref:uncharacterized protein LOC118453495 n=1 Tax=Neolamprologus brichardi TaxID=32507 RepID=UPI00164372D1